MAWSSVFGRAESQAQRTAEDAEAAAALREPMLQDEEPETCSKPSRLPPPTPQKHAGDVEEGCSAPAMTTDAVMQQVRELNQWMRVVTCSLCLIAILTAVGLVASIGLAWRPLTITNLTIPTASPTVASSVNVAASVVAAAQGTVLDPVATSASDTPQDISYEGIMEINQLGASLYHDLYDSTNPLYDDFFDYVTDSSYEPVYDWAYDTYVPTQELEGLSAQDPAADQLTWSLPNEVSTQGAEQQEIDFQSEVWEHVAWDSAADDQVLSWDDADSWTNDPMFANWDAAPDLTPEQQAEAAALVAAAQQESTAATQQQWQWSADGGDKIDEDAAYSLMEGLELDVPYAYDVLDQAYAQAKDELNAGLQAALGDFLPQADAATTTAAATPVAEAAAATPITPVATAAATPVDAAAAATTAAPVDAAAVPQDVVPPQAQTGEWDPLMWDRYYEYEYYMPDPALSATAVSGTEQQEQQALQEQAVVDEVMSSLYAYDAYTPQELEQPKGGLTGDPYIDNYVWDRDVYSHYDHYEQYNRYPDSYLYDVGYEGPKDDPRNTMYV